jgi:hypothetical protein
MLLKVVTSMRQERERKGTQITVVEHQIYIFFNNTEDINFQYLNYNQEAICAKLLPVRPDWDRLESQTVRSEPDRLSRAGPFEPWLGTGSVTGGVTERDYVQQYSDAIYVLLVVLTSGKSSMGGGPLRLSEENSPMTPCIFVRNAVASQEVTFSHNTHRFHQKRHSSHSMYCCDFPSSI